MFQWKRVKSAAEWGFFLGVLSWLLSTGISNRISTAGVWAIIFSRTLSGVVIGAVRWNTSWWVRGSVIGGIVNLPLAVWIVRWPHFNYANGFWPVIITGMICGLIIEWVLKHRHYLEKKSQD